MGVFDSDDTQKMSRGMVFAVVAAAVIICSLTVVLVYTDQGTGESSSSSESSLASSSSTIIGTNSTRCSITGEPFGVVLRVVSDSGYPISGADISGESVAICGSQRQTNELPSSSTNSSGLVSFLEGYPGNYQLGLTISGQHYNVTVPTLPMYATYATLTLPSGNLTTSYCYANTGCLESSTQSSQSLR